MYKILSNSTTILNVTIVNREGKEVDACLLPNGYLNSRRITPTLEKYDNSGLVTIIESHEGRVIKNEDYQKPFSESNGDSGATRESIDITESTSEVSETSVEESEVPTPKATSRAKAGRKKKSTPVVEETLEDEEGVESVEEQESDKEE